MFYEEVPEATVRFGDVLTGFLTAVPSIERPSAPIARWALNVDHPVFVVNMTPCCSVAEQSVLLAPLRQLRSAILQNPWFAEDLARINGKVPPERSVAPEAWTRIAEPEKQRRISLGEQFVFQDLFVYSPHQQLPQYELKKGEQRWDVRHYSVDFKTIFRLESSCIQRGRPLPGTAKIAQLSKDARRMLRERVAHFFGRVPEEDLLPL